MNDFISDWSVPIVMDNGWDRLLEQPVYDAVFLPWIPRKCKTTEIRYHRSISYTEFKRAYEIDQKQHNGFYPIENTVVSVKEKEIILSILYVCGLVYRRYTKVAKKYDKPLNAENFRQIIEIPMTMKDLVPGSTTIVFDIFTKRKLEYIGS